VTAIQPRSDDNVAIWWKRSLQAVRDEFRGLVRVSRIDHPEAVLLSPEQSFFVRENLKLMLINARLGLLARQPAAVRADLAKATTALNKYFDGSADKLHTANRLLEQVRAQMTNLALPRVDETLSALDAAANSR
jgi:uroporphyrin-3 C-methyltransferase